MPIKLSIKLFGAFFLIMVIVVSAMVFSRYLFFRNFRLYILQEEIKQLEALVPSLQEAYQEHGSWESVLADPASWRRQLTIEPHVRKAVPPPPSKGERHAMEPRVLLTDDRQQAVIGTPAPGDHVKLVAIHLILLDLMLPGLDGIAVCREIRKFSNVPIIMVTAKVEEVDRLIGLEIGADDYICKPFSPREVVARVKAVLRRTHPNDPPRRLVVGPLLLDEDSREVTVDGKPTNLTPSEFGLLSVLMSSPERVFSRSELVDKIQGYRFEGYDRTIDSHVKNLRKKIAARLPGKEVIQTIYGVGYRLSV